jgi:hypothetical protein
MHMLDVSRLHITGLAEADCMRYAQINSAQGTTVQLGLEVSHDKHCVHQELNWLAPMYGNMLPGWNLAATCSSSERCIRSQFLI